MKASQRRILIWLVTLGFLVWCAGAVAQEPSSATQNAPSAPAVKLSVIVTDHANHSLDDLSKDQIRILEDNVPQTISLFEKNERPVNYAIAMDTSGSFKNLLGYSLNAAKTIITGNRADDATLLIRFTSSDKIETICLDKIKTLCPFVSDQSKLRESLKLFRVEGGQTAVIDAVYVAVKATAEHESHQSATRRAVVLISDGEDRASYYKEEQLAKLLRVKDVQVFVIGIVAQLDNARAGVSPRDKAERLLKQIAQESGGRVFFPKSTADLARAVTEIVHDLHVQYEIGYESASNSGKDNFRAVEVRIVKPLGGEKLTAITRRGYYLNPPDLSSQEQDKKKKKKSD